MNLKEFFAENKRAALGFSGGVDSAYLLYASKKYGAYVQPYYIKTQFQPEFELNDALKLCGQLDIKLKIIELDILSDNIISSNPKDRCYYCKKRLFSALKQNAHADGIELIIDGTNASDSIEDRPGMKAINELCVRSPLRECGLTKKQIRKLSKEAGLFTWDKPSYACLATRIPVDVVITKDSLKKVERAEEKLSLMGFRDFRVRIYDETARIQVKESQLLKLIENRQTILSELKPYFDIVMVDMETR